MIHTTGINHTQKFPLPEFGLPEPSIKTVWNQENIYRGCFVMIYRLSGFREGRPRNS